MNGPLVTMFGLHANPYYLWQSPSHYLLFINIAGAPPYTPLLVIIFYLLHTLCNYSEPPCTPLATMACFPAPSHYILLTPLDHNHCLNLGNADVLGKTLCKDLLRAQFARVAASFNDLSNFRFLDN